MMRWQRQRRGARQGSSGGRDGEVIAPAVASPWCRGASGSRAMARPEVTTVGCAWQFAHVHGMGRPRSDRTLGTNQPEAVTRMNFKALNMTKRLLQEPNQLRHAQDVI